MYKLFLLPLLGSLVSAGLLQPGAYGPGLGVNPLATSGAWNPYGRVGGLGVSVNPLASNVYAPNAANIGIHAGLNQLSADSLGVGAYGGAAVNQYPVNSLEAHAVNKWAANALAANQLAANQAAANQLTANALAAAQAATNQLAANLWASNRLSRNQAIANHLSAKQLAVNQALAQRLAQRQLAINTAANAQANQQYNSINPAISFTNPYVVAANSLQSGTPSIGAGVQSVVTNAAPVYNSGWPTGASLATANQLAGDAYGPLGAAAVQQQQIIA